MTTEMCEAISLANTTLNLKPLNRLRVLQGLPPLIVRTEICTTCREPYQEYWEHARACRSCVNEMFSSPTLSQKQEPTAEDRAFLKSCGTAW